MGGAQQSIKYNTPLPNSKEEGFTAVYRSAEYANCLIQTPQEGLSTLRDIAINSVKKYSECNAFGKIVLTVEKDSQGKDIGIERRTIENYTYQEIFQKAEQLGKAIIARKLDHLESVHSMRFLGIYSKNRLEWMITDIACILFGITSTPLYDTLGVDNLSYCLNQTQMTSLCVTEETVKVLLTLKDLGNLHTLISYDKLDQKIISQIQQKKIELLYLSDLIEEGKQRNDIKYSDFKVSPEDCFTFSYTSGTTGPPKGAMLSHRNFVAVIASIKTNKSLCVTHNDVTLSFLPLPHVLQRLVVHTNLYFGANTIFYSGNMLKLKDDMQIAKPTAFIGVPRIFNRIVDAIKNKFNNESGIKKYIIDYSLSKKLGGVQYSGAYQSYVYDYFVFSKVKETFGGRIKFLASGSAPMIPKNQQFLKAVMCCPFMEAYGPTQATGLVSIQSPMDPTLGHVGQISHGLQLKLADIPQMNYTSADVNEEGKLQPRGEILLRGPMVFMGYYKLPEVTAETITKDGWLRTGDVGKILHGTNALKIIDRKKNIFKLQQGEYIAPDKVEAVYCKNKIVEEIFLHGQSTQNFAIAIIKPEEKELKAFAESLKIQGEYLALCSNPQIKLELLKFLNKIGKSEGLYGFEQPKNIHLQPQAFVNRGILTNTMKLQRFQAKVHYKKVIQSLYEEGDLISKE